MHIGIEILKVIVIGREFLNLKKTSTIFLKKVVQLLIHEAGLDSIFFVSSTLL